MSKCLPSVDKYFSLNGSYKSPKDFKYIFIKTLYVYCLCLKALLSVVTDNFLIITNKTRRGDYMR